MDIIQNTFFIRVSTPLTRKESMPSSSTNNKLKACSRFAKTLLLLLGYVPHYETHHLFFGNLITRVWNETQEGGSHFYISFDSCLNSFMTDVSIIQKPVQSKSMDWFLYHRDLHHQRVKTFFV